MSVEPPPVASTIKMNVVPEEHRTAALRLAGEVMAENTNQAISHDEDSSFTVLAKANPTAVFAGYLINPP